LLEDDIETKVICLYIEGVRDGERFFTAAKRIAARKPLLLLKGGATPSGALAARSHTGALSGDDAIFRNMCRQTGIVDVETMDEMVDVAGMFLSQPAPAGKKVGIVTLGGGWGVIATDMCSSGGLQVAPLDEKVVARLDKILPPFWSRRNPVDLVAPDSVDVIAESIGVLIENGGMDAILMLGLGYASIKAQRWMASPVIPAKDAERAARLTIAAEMKLIRLLVEQVHRYGKPIIPVIDIMAFDEKMEVNPVDYLDDAGIMSYSAPDQAIKALAKVAAYYDGRNS
ncbi:MAG: hypothetical protein PHY31_02410, partial [Smithellaceae bacterium]|nr:hypothetical protein [Smithellaceae bacterium]